MACGDTNGGCGENTTSRKFYSRENIKYLLNYLSGKICLAVGSIKATGVAPMHLDKTQGDEGIVLTSSIDKCTTTQDGYMSAADKVKLDDLESDYNSLSEAVSGLSKDVGTLSDEVNDIDLSLFVKNSDYVSSTKDGIASKENYDDWYNLYDKVFIVCRVGREEDFEINLVSPSAIKAGHFSERTMYGIAILQDTKMFIVALGESEEPIAWSSGYGLAGTALATAKEAIVDADGESNTDTIIAASTEGFITNTSDYAAGFCRNYSNDMFPAGSWYLPSMYELLVIKSHLREINYALNIIGATPIRYENVSGQAYWASSERSAETAWQLNMFESHLVTNNKVEARYYVRPVTVMRTEKIYTYGDIEVEMSYPTVPYSGGTVCPELTYKQTWTCSDGTSGEITDGADVTLRGITKNSKWSSTTTAASYSVDASGNVTISGHAGLEAGTYLLQITLQVKLNGKAATASAYVYQETEE